MHPMPQSKFVLLALSLTLAACASQPTTHKDAPEKGETNNTRRVRCMTVPAVGVPGSYVQTMTNVSYSSCNGS